MKPIVENLACTTAQASVNHTWHPLSNFGSEFNIAYSITAVTPAVATAANYVVHGTLVDVVAVGTPSAAATFILASVTAASPIAGHQMVTAQSKPITAIMVSLADCSSDATGTFRLVQQGV